jgi:DNA-binding IclR family transcriptional regulator
MHFLEKSRGAGDPEIHEGLQSHILGLQFHLMEPTVGGIGVLDKAIVVLDAVEDRPANLAELVAATGLPRATTHRLATALERHGLLRRTDDGRFHLGGRLIALGRNAEGDYSVTAIATPILGALRDATSESVQLYVPDGTMRLCLIALDSPYELRTIVAEGARLPLHLGSAGRVLTAAGTSEQPWVATVEEREVGVASVSAPVTDSHGAVIAAVSISGPVERLGKSPGKRFGATVAAAAQRLGEALSSHTGGGAAPGSR